MKRISSADRTPGVRGATADGRTRDTRAIQRAIDERAVRGGGTVTVPAGTYLVGSLFLRSRVTLHLDDGAVLLASEDPSDYPVIESRWEGRTCRAHAPLVGGVGLDSVGVVGRGKIDGRGDSWWRRHRDGSLSFPRPRLISFTDCRRVLIQGIEAVNSPSWTVNPVRCDDCIVDGITIRNPADSPNTDGINPDSCTRVRISNCLVSVGDDCLAIKSGVETEKPELLLPSRDITITNCVFESGHGGVVIGSEIAGGVSRVTISNCVFNGTDRGVRLKARRGRGGVVEDVLVSNVVMSNVRCPVTMNLYYACGAWGDPRVSDKGLRPVDAGTPRFRGICISGLTARGVKHTAAFLYGLAESPIEDVSIADARISLDPDATEGYPEMADGLWPMAREGLFARCTRGLSLDRVRIDGQRGSAFTVEDSEGLQLRGCGTGTPVLGAPTVRLKNVKGS